MITARERVLTSMRFEEPAETPFVWGFGPTKPCRLALQKALGSRGIDFNRLFDATSDVIRLHPLLHNPFPPEVPEYMGIWGIKTCEIAVGEAVYSDEIDFSPLAGAMTVAEIEDHPWPDLDAYDYQSMVTQVETKDPGGLRALQANGGNPFEIYTWMTGMEEAMINLLDEPEMVHAAMRHIVDFFKERLNRMVAVLERPLDIIQIGDDLGTQTGPLLSPPIYREMIQPFHRELCDHIRGLLPDAVIAYHTDGSVFDLIPDLLDAGVQMLEAVQIECAGMEPQRLKDNFGDRLRFQGAISVQALLPSATPERVREECRKLVSILGKGGGYLPAPSHAVQVGTPAENVLAMLEGVLGAERYEKMLEEARC